MASHILIWDLRTCKPLQKITTNSKSIYAYGVSRAGDRIVIQEPGGILSIFDTTSGRQINQFMLKDPNGVFMSFDVIELSPDGSKLVLGGERGIIQMIDSQSGKIIHKFATKHNDKISHLIYSPDGMRIISADETGNIGIWEATSGTFIKGLKQGAEAIRSIGVSPDGRYIMSLGSDGSFHLHDATTFASLVRVFAWMKDGPYHVGPFDWLALTPPGFFSGSELGANQLAVVRGRDSYPIGQVYRSLFNPELVMESVSGDPNQALRDAGKVINLDKVLESGPAPTVEIELTGNVASVETDILKVTSRIHDSGKGVGRIEWRVNGITAAVREKPSGSGPDFVLHQDLALDPGENTIEVTAYNASNLLASLPARATVKLAASASTVKPRLHILAIGINDYVDRGWHRPDGAGTVQFPRLDLAVKDAAALGQALKEGGSEHYADVKVTLALDSDATVASLERHIERMAMDIHPRDTFVLFAAAHGTSELGRFYLIPQDFQSGPGALAAKAIGQDRLQDWVSNRIRARKAIIMLDTCESGALVAGSAKSRTDTAGSETAVGRLHEATGRPVLTAAAQGQYAYEVEDASQGIRHGLFTYAVLDALRNGDSDGSGTIELSELVAHVQTRVPSLAARLGGSGRAAIAVGGAAANASPNPNSVNQSAHFGSRGEDFTLVGKLP